MKKRELMGDRSPDSNPKKQIVADEAAGSNGRRSAGASPLPVEPSEQEPLSPSSASAAASPVNGAGRAAVDDDGDGKGEALSPSAAAVTGVREEEEGEEEEEGSSLGGGGGRRRGNGGGDGQASGGGGGGMEPTSAIKLLVSAGLAGCLIGKAGATINELQERTGARIKLSQNNDYFPGTQDRIVLLSGDPDTVTHALSLVIEHLHSNAQARASMSLGGGMGGGTGGGSNNHLNGSNNGVVVVGGMGSGQMAPSPLPLPPPLQGGQGEVMGGGTTSVKLLIAKGAGGLVIGRGGATIKMLNEESGARIQLAAKDEAAGVVTGERVVTISGPLDGVLKGVSRIMEKLHEEPELARYQNLTTSYSRSTSAVHPLHPAFDVPTYHTQSFAETQQLFSPGGPGCAPSPGHGQPPSPAHSTSAITLTLQVPDRLVGSILGKAGSTLKEIQQQTGTRVTISKRGDFAPGTQHRVVTIEGPAYNAEMARSLLHTRVQQASLGPPPLPPAPSPHHHNGIGGGGGGGRGFAPPPLSHHPHHGHGHPPPPLLHQHHNHPHHQHHGGFPPHHHMHGRGGGGGVGGGNGGGGWAHGGGVPMGQHGPPPPHVHQNHGMGSLSHPQSGHRGGPHGGLHGRGGGGRGGRGLY